MTIAGLERFDALWARLVAVDQTSKRWARAWIAVWVPITAFALRLTAAGHGVVTVDEPTWLARSQRWFEAITHLHPGRATVPLGVPKTRPGVTTMWIGSTARGITLLGRKIGLVHSVTTPFERSPVGLQVAQVLVALVCSLLIGLIAVLVARLISRTIGCIAGVVLACEPFLIGHTSVLHTDGILALTLVASGLALMVALQLGSGDEATAPFRRRWAVAAGVLVGLALLTKISALVYLPGLLIPAVVAAVRLPREDWRSGFRSLVTIALLSIGAAILTILVLWPALWVDPISQVHALIDSARLGETGHPTFFKGRTTTEPGWTYYLYVLQIRAWITLLVAGIGIIAAVSRRSQRRPALTIAVIPVPYLIAVSAATKQFDRYSLPIIVTLGILAAVGAAGFLRGVSRLAHERSRSIAPRPSSPTDEQDRIRGADLGGSAVLLLAIILIVSFVVSMGPYQISYLGPEDDSGYAARTILVGWGEGLEQAGRAITKDREGRCDGVVTAVPAIHNYISFPCGVIVPLRARVYRNLSDITYAVDSISEDQRNTKTHQDYFALVRAQGTLIKTVRIRGLVYARVYRIDHPPPGACKDDLMAVPYAPRCG